MHVKTLFIKNIRTNKLQREFVISIGVLMGLAILLLVTATPGVDSVVSPGVGGLGTGTGASVSGTGGADGDWRLMTLQTLRIVLGSIALLFLPGYRLTRALFLGKALDTLEIIALSFAFSISVVPLLVFYANLAGVPITARLVVGVCALILGGSRGYLVWKERTDA